MKTDRLKHSRVDAGDTRHGRMDTSPIISGKDREFGTQELITKAGPTSRNVGKATAKRPCPSANIAGEKSNTVHADGPIAPAMLGWKTPIIFKNLKPFLSFC